MMGMYLAHPRGAFFPTVSGVATVLYAMLTVCSVAWQGRLGYTMQHKLHKAGEADNPHRLHNATRPDTVGSAKGLARQVVLVY